MNKFFWARAPATARPERPSGFSSSPPTSFTHPPGASPGAVMRVARVHPRAPALFRASADAPDPPRRRDYDALLSRGARGGPPALFLAPMEGLGDRRLRRALALSTGGFDEACREFTRVPGVISQGAKPEKLLRGIALNGYDAEELLAPATLRADEHYDCHPTMTGYSSRAYGGGAPESPRDDESPLSPGSAVIQIPSRAPALLAAQLMGSNPDLLETCASYLATETSAPRVDLNCGCPAGLVTGKGAGSSLLRDPLRVRECVAAVARGVAGTGCAVTLKLRSGFDDRGLLRENLLAAQEGGAEFVTLHPRTRAQGYSGAARWEDIAFAADLLRVPVVGNGDVTTPERAFRMVRETGCAGVMIGRGAVQDPLIFHRIREAGGWFGDDGSRAAALTTAGGRSREEEAELVRAFLRRFAEEVFAEAPRKPRRSAKRGDDLERFKLGKLKQIVKYLFASNPALEASVAEVLSADHEETTPGEMLMRVDRLVAERWDTPRDVAVDGFSMRTRYERSEGGGAARKARAAT